MERRHVARRSRPDAALISCRAMDLTAAERAVLERFREKCTIAGGPRAGYTLRLAAIRQVAAQHPGVDLDAGLAGLVEKGLLKRNEKGDFYYLAAAGAALLEGAAA
jgi:hypothetical protein